MASYNRVILMGNVTRDIELRYTTSGMAVTEVGLAVNDRRKNAAGEWVDEANYFDITMFGRTAEIAAEYLSKGSPVFIEGKLKYDTWEKDGQKRSKVHVICDRMQLIGSRTEGSGGGGGSSGGGGRSSSSGSSSGGGSSGGSSSGGGGAAPRAGGQPPLHRQQQEPDVYEDENIPF